MRSVFMSMLQGLLEIPHLPEELYEDARQKIAALKAEGTPEVPKVSEEVGQAWLESVLLQQKGRLN